MKTKIGVLKAVLVGVVALASVPAQADIIKHFVRLGAQATNYRDFASRDEQDAVVAQGAQQALHERILRFVTEVDQHVFADDDGVATRRHPAREITTLERH